MAGYAGFRQNVRARVADYFLSTLCDALESLVVVRFLVRELKLYSHPLEVLGKAVGK